jgi:hypothetical protein
VRSDASTRERNAKCAPVPRQRVKLKLIEERENVDACFEQFPIS